MNRNAIGYSYDEGTGAYAYYVYAYYCLYENEDCEER